MGRISILNTLTARRARSLGELGESLAESILARSGFTNVKNLNHSKMNFPFADFYAERKGEKYIISVKIRNKYEANTGKLNARYNLGRKCYELAAKAEFELSAQAAFLAISLMPNSYCAYFAPLVVLNKSLGIPMTNSWLVRYECLAENVAHGVDVSHLKNTYSLKTTVASMPEL
ncbi:MAG TPA: hypothetical protein VK810_06430 [Dongiaceae bacterium]|jgi:hypothetical protein|nr:hypothetical protein [Dongiaceae bacterium]